MLFLPCLMIAMKVVKPMKIKRMVKHSDTEFEIMEFELTEEEELAIFSELLERTEKAWMRQIMDDILNTEYVMDNDDLAKVDTLLDEAYEEYVDEVVGSDWDTAFKILSRKCEDYFEEE